MSIASETAILNRIIKPDEPVLPREFARVVLQWEFHPSDRQRMTQLLAKAKAGKLSRAEKVEAEKYERVGHFLSILKSQARQSLKPRRNAS